MISIECHSNYKNLDIIPYIVIDWEENININLGWLFWEIQITFKKI